MPARARFRSGPVAAIVAAFGLGAALFAYLPAQIPIHWNGAGEPDGYGPRAMVFVLPLVMVVQHALLSALPTQATSDTATAASYRRLHVGVLLTLLALHTTVLAWALAVG